MFWICLIPPKKYVHTKIVIERMKNRKKLFGISLSYDYHFLNIIDQKVNEFGIFLMKTFNSRDFLKKINENYFDFIIIDADSSEEKTNIVNLIKNLRETYGIYQPIFILSENSKSKVVQEVLELGSIDFIFNSPEADIVANKIKLLLRCDENLSIKNIERSKFKASFKIKIKIFLTMILKHNNIIM